jgi:hypothetical protein
LKESYKSSYEHTKWNLDILHLFEEIFGDKSEIYVKFNHLTWQNRGKFRLTMHPEKEVEYQNHHGYLADLETARGIIKFAIDLIMRKGIGALEGNKLSKTKTKKRARLTPSERWFVWEHKEMYGRICNICGEEILNFSDLEFDHTKPYSKGGDKMVLAIENATE